MTTITTNSNLFGQALRANAIFSGASGILFVLTAGNLSELIGIQPPLVFTIAGLGLMIYSAFLFRLRRSHPVYITRIVWAVIIVDLLWVVDSAALLVTGWLPLTVTGQWAIAIVADVVLLFAIWQYFGLRRMQKTD